MKRFTQYIIVVLIACMAALTAQARTISINAKTVKGDLTEYLRNVAQGASYKDTVVVSFDKGSYTINGSIIFNCHLVMTGMGQQHTTVIFNKGTDRPGFKAFNDDCFIDVFGTLARPLSAVISDISFQLQDHTGIWWKDSRNYLFKIRHCNRVNISRVKSYIANAISTNFDLHVCSNVTVTDCDITNYNNSEGGGCLWLRGEAHNVSIKRNKFTKYGKDEALAVFDRLVNHSKQYIRGNASRSDIMIEDNEFIYGGYKGKDKDPESNCGMVFSLFTDENDKNHDRCVTRNFHLRGNKFYINDVTTRCIYIGFDPADEHRDIYIENNEIVNGDIGRDYRFYHKDIEVHDLSTCGDTIRIKGNSVRNRAMVLNSSDETGYMFIQSRGGIIKMDGNKIVNEVNRKTPRGKAYGMQLIWCQEEGGDVTMVNNVCKGLSYLGYVGGGNGTPLFTLNAHNNYFEGNTRIYSHKVQKMNLNFTNNTFMSDGECFFLQEFAPRGSVVFTCNDVTVRGGNGKFMTHWGSNSSNSMRFDRLEVSGNVFKGVKDEKDLFHHVTNVGKRKVKSNRISRY